MFPKAHLIQAPTPLHRLDNLSADLGLDLWIKRDDLTGFAMGGNKGRKLEYQIADALVQGADTVVTCGASQSNYIRQLGAACSMNGLRCIAATMRAPYEYEPASGGLQDIGGNVRLDWILDVEIHAYRDDTWETLYQHAAELAATERRSGSKVYEIPVGGSSPLGAFAFLEAGKELQAQGEFDWIVFASSSGSTQTGLMHAYRGTGTKILGIACDPEPEIAEDFAELSRGLAALMGETALTAQDYLLKFDYVGKGYGIGSEAGWATIERVAQREGVFLDPVYSGKAFAGLIDLTEKGEIGGRVCFWHTGGIPTLFADSW